MIELSNFFQRVPLPSNMLHGSYSLSLVAISYGIAFFSSYIALDFAGKLRIEPNQKIKWYWLMGGAFSMGAGIWSMHFIGMLAFIMPAFVIHQFGALGMVGGPSEVGKALPSYATFMADYGNVFRTYQHGALHGAMIGLFVALPVIATNCLFEQKSFRYAAITSGYWIIVMTLMGAIICGWK